MKLYKQLSETRSENASVIHLPVHWGQNKVGVSKAPAVLAEPLNLHLMDRFDSVRHLGFKKNLDSATSNNYQTLHDFCFEAQAHSQFSLFLGGDHSVGLATVSAMLRRHPDLGVLWVDAHGDINTPQTSPTGHVHGMPVAHLLGLVRCQQQMPWLKQLLPASKLVYIGVRDLDPGEAQAIELLGVKMFSADEVHRLGMEKVLELAITHLSVDGPCPLHLSFDIDAVDPFVAPATGVPVPGGLIFSQVQSLGVGLHNTGRVVSADFVELNPELAASRQCLARTTSVFSGLLSSMLTGYNFFHDSLQKSALQLSGDAQTQFTS